MFEEADDGLKRVLERIASLYEIRHVVAPDEPISTHGLVSASNDENSNTYPHPFFLGTEWLLFPVLIDWKVFVTLIWNIIGLIYGCDACIASKILMG